MKKYVCCIAFGMAAGTWGATRLPAAAVDASGPCCFSNSRYQGVCTVNPVKGEKCQSILAYLNNPMSTGKSYCGGTTIRRGWIRVDCKTGKPVTDKKNASGAGQKSQGHSQEQVP